jgi:hypothetical protein
LRDRGDGRVAGGATGQPAGRWDPGGARVGNRRLLHREERTANPA